MFKRRFSLSINILWIFYLNCWWAFGVDDNNDDDDNDDDDDDDNDNDGDVDISTFLAWFLNILGLVDRF